MKTFMTRTAMLLISSTSLTAALAGTGQAQVYSYQSTIGVPGAMGSDNSHFNGPSPGAIDTVNGHLLIADLGNNRVQVYDSTTLAYVTTLGVTGVAGSDNGHFDFPDSVGFDPTTDHIFISDLHNFRVQVFDAKTFAYVATIGTAGVSGTDNAHFAAPGPARVNTNAGQLYVVDQDNQRVQIFSTATLAYIATLGQTGTSGTDPNHFALPSDAEYNPVNNQIMVADTGNARVQIFNASSLVPVQAIGGLGTGGTSTDNAHLASPTAVAFDPASNLVLAIDNVNSRVQVFNGATYAYVTTLGVTGVAGSDNGHFNGPAGIVADPVHSRLFIGDIFNERVQVFSDVPSPLHSSVLPGARSVQLGVSPTVFANILNSGPNAMSNCEVSLPASAPPGLTMTYQTTDPSNNHPIGSVNTPASIAAPSGESLSSATFVLAFSDPNALIQLAQPLEYSCDGVALASTFVGVNTVDLTFSATPVADVIALVATSPNDGILRIPVGGTGALAVASENIGATDSLTVALDTAGVDLPIIPTVCQTNPANSQCLAPPASSVTISYATGTTPTFAVFASASQAIALDPVKSRLFLRFLDGAGNSHGATSVAVETN